VIQRVDQEVDCGTILRVHRSIQVLQQYVDIEVRCLNQLHEIVHVLLLWCLKRALLFNEMLLPGLSLLLPDGLPVFICKALLLHILYLLSGAHPCSLCLRPHNLSPIFDFDAVYYVFGLG